MEQFHPQEAMDKSNKQTNTTTTPLKRKQTGPPKNKQTNKQFKSKTEKKKKTIPLQQNTYEA